MTPEEFSSTFDILFNNVASNQAPGVNEYEKSVFLTESQEEYVIALYNGTNPLSKSFEETEELRRYLSCLIEEAELSPITNSSGMPIGIAGSNSYFFTLPDGIAEEVEEGEEPETPKPAVWYITYESVNLDKENRPCAGISSLQVTPIRQDQYHRLRKNPFRGANNRRALRLDLPENIVEIISQFKVKSYYLRYLRKPNPIIVEDLDGGLTINGSSNRTECELPEALHYPILELAVRKATQALKQN